MLCHTLFYGCLLSAAVFAQLSVPISSGVARPSGVCVGRNSTKYNVTHIIPLVNATGGASASDVKDLQPTVSSIVPPPKQSTKATRVYTATSDASKHSSATRKPHMTCKKPVAAVSVSSTASGPTETAGVVYSGTGTSGGLGKPTGVGSTSTKGSGPCFLNRTATLPSQQGTSIPHTSSTIPTKSSHVSPTGSSSAFAEPSAANSYTLPAFNSSATTSKSSRLLCTKSNGSHVANSTSGVPSITGTGASYSVMPTNTRIVSVLPTASRHSACTKHSSSQSSSTSTRILPTATSASFTIIESGSSFTTFSASSTQSVQNLTSTSMRFNTTISKSACPRTRAITSTVATVPTTMITKASPTSLVASTGFFASTSSPASPSNVIIAQYYQCDGINFKGKGTCVKGTVCKERNPYYYQCVDENLA
ncbi:hypothetical protein BKA65DRAFT_591437 [Rhexocercosporidium sp. MPI-PUGE-AT-0058]|nr:hypothetical protein BKA65DRAFT_591437 [Rhexocercosporidium sp. MPI-PUGE-AT-0058]